MIQGFQPTGNLDKDSSPQEIGQGSYVDALDVRPVSNDGQNSKAYENILGNKSDIHNILPVVAGSNKSYSLSYPSSGTWSSDLFLYAADGTYLSFATVTQTTPVTTIEGMIDTAIGVAQSYSGSNPLIVTFINYGDYILRCPDGIITVVQTSESLNPGVNGQTGQLYSIGSKDINGDVFIFSTCCNNSTGGTGEIGVQLWDANAQTTEYVTLLRSKEFAWSSQYQFGLTVRITGEVASGVISLYYVNGFNNDRKFYYKGDYVENGAIKSVNADGFYSYGSIASELRLDTSDAALNISYSQQIPSGGNLLSGSWYYAVRLLTPALDATAYSQISNQFICYTANAAGAAILISGNQTETITSRINEIQVTGIDATTFKYIELVAVHLSASSQTGFFIKRINTTGSTMLIQHTGNETTVSDFDLTNLEISDLSFIPKNSKCITINKNHLLRWNLTAEDRADFSTVAAAITLSTIVHEVANTGYITGGLSDNFRYGGYQNPETVFDYTGYMENETYLFGIRFLLLSGIFTEVFKIGTIAIQDSSANLTTDFGLNNIRIRGVQCDNIDTTTIKDRILGFEIVRAELIPEILATGALIIGYKAASDNKEYPLLYDWWIGGYALSTWNPGFGALDTKAGILYSPDILFGATTYSFAAGDKLLFYGTPKLAADVIASSGSDEAFLGEWTGYYNISGNSFTTLDIADAQPVSEGGNTTFSGGLVGTWNNVRETSLAKPGQFQRGIVISVTSPFVSPTAFDYGIYNVQIKRPKPTKYANTDNTNYLSTGTFYTVDINTPVVINSLQVFGGETYLIKNYLHAEYPTGVSPWLGAGIGYYAQSKVNVQMRYSLPDSIAGGYVFPIKAAGTTISDKMISWLIDLNQEQIFYDFGYSDNRTSQEFIAFDSNLIYPSKYPARGIFSPVKPEGSTTDYYGVLLPGDFRDESLTEGEITGAIVLNGELYTLSNGALRKQYFGTPTQVVMTGSENLTIQSGSGFSQNSTRISAYGCSHFHAWVLGKSSTGDDTIYWIDTTHKKFCRFAQDGTRVLSDIDGMKTFFANNLQFAALYDTPCYNWGINGVWDDRFGEAIFTVKAQYLPLDGDGNIITWQADGEYLAGEIVSDGNYTTGFEDMLNIWKCLQATGQSGDAQPLSNAAYWKPLTDTTDNTYFNLYTIAFNELKSGFTTFYTFKPYIYIQTRNTFYSPTSNKADGKIWLHNAGTVYSTWYGTQTAIPYITGIINQDSTIERIYQFLIIYGLYKPKVEFITHQTETYINPSEFQFDGDRITLNIFNDTLTADPLDPVDERMQDTRKISGTYIFIKVSLITPESNFTYNKLNYLLVGNRPRNPKYIYK